MSAADKTPFSDFYETIRLILGDRDPYQVFDYSDDDLDGAIRGVFLLGKAPEGFSLLGSDRQGATDIIPFIPNGDAFALIVYESALMLVGGEEGTMRYSTRALSHSVSNDRHRHILGELRSRIYEIRAGKEQFVSIQSFATWIAGVISPYDLAVSITPAPNVGVQREINIGLL
jgi:hypothetical protein